MVLAYLPGGQGSQALWAESSLKVPSGLQEGAGRGCEAGVQLGRCLCRLARPGRTCSWADSFFAKHRQCSAAEPHHSVATDAPVVLTKVPAGAAMQARAADEDAVSGLKKPTGQSLHSLLPVESVSLPGGHQMHADVAPVVSWYLFRCKAVGRTGGALDVRPADSASVQRRAPGHGGMQPVPAGRPVMPTPALVQATEQ